ncbi:MAG: HpcH/HpaI aldolase family protein [Hyphomicrobiaceae bacterium]|jgi:2-dehydro-3-deoxyglucarate aldolase/4-hydroxy-2-oxoheptanedioate aldolase
MSTDSLRARVMAGRPVLGSMLFELFAPGIPQMLTLAGCEYVIYDMEHTGAGLETVKAQVAACRGLPIAPMVRVPRGEYHFLARALDIGCHGVMIPMVETAAQAKAIAESTHYPPVGRRGAAFGFAHDDYKPGTPAEKIAAAHARTLVIAQIETEHGLANVEAIAATPGVDVLWVGHFDLTNFLGIPGQFEHPKYQEAIRRVVAAGRAHGKGLGFMAASHETAKEYMDLGFNMIAAGTDQGLLVAGVKGIIGGLGGK